MLWQSVPCVGLGSCLGYVKDQQVSFCQWSAGCSPSQPVCLSVCWSVSPSPIYPPILTNHSPIVHHLCLFSFTLPIPTFFPTSLFQLCLSPLGHHHHPPPPLHFISPTSFFRHILLFLLFPHTFSLPLPTLTRLARISNSFFPSGYPLSAFVFR